MKVSRVLESDIAHYKRARAKGFDPVRGVVDQDYSIGFLRSAMERYVQDVRDETNLNNQHRAITHVGAPGGKFQEAAPSAE